MALWRRKERAKETRAEGSRAQKGWTPEQIQSLFDQRCDHGDPLVLVSCDGSCTCQARFLTVTDQLAVVEILSSTGEAPPKVPTLVSAMFNVGTRAFVFLSQIVRVDQEEDRALAWLCMPEDIASTEARFAFRVPAQRMPGLEIRVSKETRSWTPSLLDMSICGVQIAFEPSEDPNLEPEDHINVDIVLEEAGSVRLAAVVRRRNGHRYGLFFPATLKEGQIVSPPTLCEIVRRVEQRWLMERPA